MITKTKFQCVPFLEVEGRNYEFDPPLLQEPSTKVVVLIDGKEGHARVYRVCRITSYLIESRLDCQVLEIDGRDVIVAAPEAIRYPYLPFHVQFLRWLARP